MYFMYANKTLGLTEKIYTYILILNLKTFLSNFVFKIYKKKT